MANRDGLLFLQEVADVISPAIPDGLYACDVFDHFSHWLKAIKKYWDTVHPSSGFWQVAPGEGARLWENFVDESIVAVGFNEIDQDLSGYSEKELLAILKEKYPEFSDQKTKVNFTQLWNFINLKFELLI
ncbi:MAG: hypothetical protein Q8P24_03120 [Desulfobacterales bacterium]|nr:hypothetical protein [Desulfobacterales bacterium]